MPLQSHLTLDSQAPAGPSACALAQLLSRRLTPWVGQVLPQDMVTATWKVLPHTHSGHGQRLCTPVLYLLAHFHDAVHVLVLWLDVTLKLALSIKMVAHLFGFPKCASPDLVRYMPPSSLITSIPRSRLNPTNHPSMTWTSTITGRACSRSSFILPYPWHLRVLPLAVNAPTSSCLHCQHTALLTSVCEHPESTRAVHSCPLTSTFTTDDCRFFPCSEIRLVLMPSPLRRSPSSLMECAQFYCIENTVICSKISVLHLTPMGVQFLTI